MPVVETYAAQTRLMRHTLQLGKANWVATAFWSAYGGKHRLVWNITCSGKFRDVDQLTQLNTSALPPELLARVTQATLQIEMLDACS